MAARHLEDVSASARVTLHGPGTLTNKAVPTLARDAAVCTRADDAWQVLVHDVQRRLCAVGAGDVAGHIGHVAAGDLRDQ